ncbi:MAG: GEVED domain-containing protein [Bacteroidales bacterium]
MKKLLLFLFALALGATMFIQHANAQVTVTNPTNTTPNLAATYTSLANAITALNATTAISGPVVITLTGNETAPVGGYSITAIPTGASLANNITIQGVTSTITAYTPQVVGTINDAIIKLVGADFITIQGFTLQENPGNTISATAALNNMTEFGIALFYASLTNGAQNNIIQNNTISLNRTYLNTFGIYSNTRHSASAMTTTAEVTAATGSNSGNKVYTNLISNVNYGIVFVGAGTTIAAIDNGNDIGGSDAGKGNTISNWGGGSALSAYTSVTTSNYCIVANQQINENISYNTITSASVAVLTAQLGGILKAYTVASPASGTITSTINNNTVTLTNSPTTSQMTGITSQGQTTLATATQNINNNKIINCSVLGASATSAAFVGFLTTGAHGTLNINGNTIRGISTNATSGVFLGIQQQTNAIVNTLNINNNAIGDVTAGAVTFTNATNSGTVTGLSVTSTGAAATCALSISNNDFRGIVHNTQGSGSNTYIINSSATLSQNISNNTFTNLTIKSTGSVTFIANSVSVPALGSQTISNNSIVTAFNKTGAGGIITLETTSAGSLSGATINHTGNNFSNITVTGATTIAGWVSSDGGTANKTYSGNTFNNWIGGTSSITAMNINWGGGAGGTGNLITNNTISNITGSGSITGINIGGSGTAATVSYNTIKGLSTTGASAVIGITSAVATSGTILKNTICNLEANNASGSVSGIVVSAGTLHNVSNNRIGDLRTPTANAANPLVGLSVTGGTTVNCYYNTVNLAATSTGALFGSSALSASTTPALTLNNNIFVNNSTANGAGLTVAYRRSTATLTTYGATSDRNDFSATNLFTDGTTTITSLTSYKSFVTARDFYSISENPPFLSTACGNTNFLKINTGIATGMESGGANIAGITDDFENDVRYGNPGYPPSGSAPDIGADEFAGTPLPLCTGTPATSTISGPAYVCTGTGTTLSLSGTYTDIGITYQWASGTTPGGPYPTVLGTAATQATGSLTVPTYYSCTVTCTLSGFSMTTVEKSVLINALPSIAVSPTSGAICNPGGTAVTLTASGGVSYAWSPTLGLSPSSGSPVLANPLTSTTYTVTGTDVNGCMNTATAAISIGVTVAMTSVVATPPSVCSGGGSSLMANAGLLANSYTGTYCQSTHTSGCSGDDMIHIVLNTLNSTASACGLTGSTPPRYLYTTGGGANTTTLSPVGGPYSLTITFGIDGTQYFGAWIDYNQDGTLAASEFLGASGNAGVSGTTSVSFTIPGTALNGVTRLRIIGGNDSPVTSAQACGASSSAWGETQDFDVTITGATPPTFTYLWSENPASGTLTSTTTNPAITTNITGPETYSVTATSAAGCSASGNVTVLLGTPVACTNITNTPACSGVDFTVTAHTTGGGGTLHYAWSDGVSGVYPDAQTVTANLAGGAYIYSVTVTDGCFTTCSMSQSITVGSPPGGTASGPATGLTYVGMPFSVTGYEPGSTFQWQVSTTSCAAGFATIGGANSDVVTLNASTAGTFYINCIVTGANGCISTTNCVTTNISVNGDNVCSAIPLSIGLNGPYSNVGATIEDGEPVPPGTGYTVQTGWGSGQTISNTVWFSFVAPPSGRVSIGNNGNFTRWDNQFALYSAETCSDFFAFNLLAANDDSTVSTAPFKAWIAPICLTPGVTYYLQVDGYGTGTNNIWGINLVAEPNEAPVISGCPSNISVPVSANNCSANVSWTAPTASDPDNCISLSFTSNYAPGANFPKGTTTVTYTANDGINAPVTCSFTVTVTQGPAVSISGDLAICAGNSNILDAGSFASYIWSTGATTQTISVNSAGNYSVTVTDGFGCTSSATVTTVVNPLPVIGLNVGGTSSVCSGSSVEITIESSISGTNYQLRNDADNSLVGLPVAGNGGTIMLPTGNLSATTTFNVLATIAATGCYDQLTGKVTITVGGPVTSIETVYICDGTTTVDIPVKVASFTNVGSMSLTFGYTDSELTNPTIVSRNAAFTGFWDPFEVTTLPAGTFKVSGYGALPGDGVTIADNEVMFTLRFNVVSGTVTSAVDLVENLQGTDLEYTGVAPDFTPFCDTPTPDFYFGGGVIVNPAGQVNNPGNQVLCNGENTADIIFATTNQGVTTYSWTNDTPGIGLAASGSGDILAFTAGNTGNEPVVATIVVTPTFTEGGVSCVGAAETFTITVNPTGQVIDPVDMVVCNGASTSVVFNTNNTGGVTTYSWTNDTPAIGLSGAGTDDIGPFTATNTGTSPVLATITVTPYFENGLVSCSGPAETFTITVNPTGQVNDPANQVVCNGASVSDVIFGTNNTGGATTFEWSNDNTSIGLGASGTGDITSFVATNSGIVPVTATITVTPYFESELVTCVGPAETFTITVNPTGQVNDPADQVVCNGATTATVTFGTNNTLGTTTYSWDNNTTTIGLASSGTGNIAAFTAVNASTAPVVATITVTPHFEYLGETCDGPAQTFTITVNPTGQVNDPADQVVCNGTSTSVSFTTVNTGGTTTYAWTNSLPAIGLPASGSGDILPFNAVNTGTTPVVATITVTPTFGGGVKGPLAGCTGAAQTFTITVNPTGQVNDPSDQILCNGGNTTAVIFTTNLTGGSTTYTWANNATSIGLGASGTGDILSFTAVNGTMSPVVATVTVTPHFENGLVTCDGPAESFTITVNPTAHVSDPADQVLCNGVNTSVTFSTNNSGGTTTYTWVNNTTSIGLGASGTGNIPVFAATNITAAPVVATITVTPQFENGLVTCSGASETFTITVNPTGQVDDPANQVVCNGAGTADVIFSTSNTGGTTTYSWVNDNAGIGLAASGTGDILGFAAINTSTAPVIATITVTPHFELCDGPAQTFTITVNPTAQLNQPATQVLCNGTSTSVNFSTINTGGITTYFWTNTNTSIGLPSFGIGNIGAFNAINTGTSPVIAVVDVTPTYTNDGVSCSGPTKSFSITVLPTGQVDQPGNQLVCNGAGTTTVTFTTENTGGTTTYAWTNNLPGIGLAASGTGNITSFTAINTTTSPVIATITVTPTFEKKGVGCPGSSKTFTITVNPSGQVIDPENQVLCNGVTTADVIFGTNNTGGVTTYTWENSTTSIGLAASGTGDISAFTAVNTTSAPVVATITVTPHFTSDLLTCDGPTGNFTITVNPTGQVDQPSSQVVCNNASTTTVLFTSVNTGGTTTYTWTNDTPAIGLVTSGSGDITAFTAVNLTTAPVIATITVTPHFENGSVTCDGSPKDFTFTVNPSGQVNDPANIVRCNGTTASVTFGTINTGGTTTYSWANNETSIGLGASGTGNIPTFTVSNSSTAPVVATITVTPHFENGSVTCDGTAQTFTITVNPSGQVNTPANQVLCTNSSSDPVNFTTNNIGGITTYTWTNNNTNIGLGASGSGNIASFTATNATNAPILATITVTPTFNTGPVGMSPPGSACTGSPVSFTITVNPNGQVNQPSNQVLSNGSSTTLVTFGTTNTGGATTYAWTNSDPSIGLAASGAGNIAAFTAVNLGVVPVVATITVTPTFTNGAVGCPGPAKTFTITVNPMPILVITNPSICSPYRINLTAPSVTAGSFLPPTTVLTYWLNAACTNPVPNPASVGNGTYYIKATITPGGWYDVKPVVATVYPLPTIFAGTGSGTYCASVPGVTVGLSGSQIGVEYTLWLGLTQISPSPVAGTGGPISFGSIPPVTGSYWALAENTTTHCQNRMYNCVHILLDPALPVSLTIGASANPVAADVDVTFTATPVNGGGTPSYQWKVNGFNVGANSPSYTYKPLNGDLVTCILTSSLSCVSGNPATSNTVIMSVTGYHTGSITVNGIVGGTATNCYNSLATITVAGGGTTFVVNSGGSATMIAGVNIVYLPGTTVLPGGYMHGYISSTDHCGAKTPSVVTVLTSEDELPVIAQKTAFKLYPNPTTGNFTVEQTSGSLHEMVKVEIYGMRGEKLFTGQLNGEMKHEFSITGYPAGLYFVKVAAGDETEIIKLIKTN